MFNESFDSRLVIWKELRENIENSNDPVQTVIDFFDQAPLVTIAADPYDQSKWPTPWELIYENLYCDFVKILAICYTLQLTKRFSNCEFVIEILKDRERKTTEYVLIIDNYAIIGLEDYHNTYASVNDIPSTTFSEMSYDMPSLV